MTTYRAVKTRSDRDLSVRVGGETLVIYAEDLPALDTPEKIKAALQEQTTLSLDDLFIHVNDDGTVAIATGVEPESWPEDETYGLHGA